MAFVCTCGDCINWRESVLHHSAMGRDKDSVAQWAARERDPSYLPCAHARHAAHLHLHLNDCGAGELINANNPKK